MFENMAQQDYVQQNSQKIDELISMVEKLILKKADKLTIRPAFKELKIFVRAEYEKVHKKKYFGTYIFDYYHPLVQEIHITALGETRANASLESIDVAVRQSRCFFSDWCGKKT